MRIPFNTAYEEGTRALNRAGETLADAQRQLSSGRRINSPSDDPLGTSTANFFSFRTMARAARRSSRRRRH